MIFSDFPQEIIAKVADLLSIEDKASCTLVSQEWKHAFQHYMYSDLVIDSKETLYNLVNPSQDTKHAYQEKEHLVQYLRISSYLMATDQEIYVLQKSFPNIKYIHFDTDSITPENFGITADWNLWRLLRELYISFEYSSMQNIENTFAKVFLCLPFLNRLEIVNVNMEQNLVSLSLNDIEAIHSHLNHLGYLKLDTSLMPLSETDLTCINVSPATNMKSLNIISAKTDYRWLYYFACKYPNLCTLKIRIANVLPDIDEQKNDTIALFKKVPLPFQHLAKLNLHYLGCTEKDYLLFWDIIDYRIVPLQHISVSINPGDTYSSDGPGYFPKCIAEICLAGFQRTIKSFHIECSERNMTPIDLMDIRGRLYHLVKLNIEAPTLPIELDALLRVAPALESLLLKYGEIRVKGELYDSKRFGLQTLKVYDSKLSSDVLRFLSFHCRSLDELHLSKSSVYGNYTAPGCQFIDMAYTRLKKLNIKETKFIIQDSKECPENLNIFLIIRPFDNVPPKQDYEPNILSPVAGVPMKAHYHWFYRPCEFNMYEVSKAQGSRIKKFFSNYEENKRNAQERALYTHTKTPLDYWNVNCVFGYTKIKLGYVAEFSR